MHFFVFPSGCDRGFGYMLALRLSSMGYRVFAACLNVNGEGPEKLRQTSSNIVTLPLDVTKDDQVAAARETVEKQLHGCGM